MDDDRENTIFEIEALESIFIHELQVSRDNSGWPQEVSIHLAPSTGDNSEEQYVKFTLVVTLPLRYPTEIPKIQIRNPRGLSEDYLEKIMKELNDIAESNRGLPVIYRLIEAGKEHLTQSNSPSGTCSICLYEFCQGDQFTRTQCYHYFHNYCLAQHVTHGLSRWSEEPANADKTPEILCPVCRLTISYSHLTGKKFPPPQESLADTDYVISKDMSELQERMKALYSKQQQKGGIIDREAERNRFLVSISRASTPITVDGQQQPADLADTSPQQPATQYYRRQGQNEYSRDYRYHRSGGHSRYRHPRCNHSYQNGQEESNAYPRRNDRAPEHRKTGYNRVDNRNTMDDATSSQDYRQRANQPDSYREQHHRSHNKRRGHKPGSATSDSSRSESNIPKCESSSSQGNSSSHMNGHGPPPVDERNSHSNCSNNRNRRKTKPLEAPSQNVPQSNNPSRPRKDERLPQNGLENITPPDCPNRRNPPRSGHTSDRTLKPPPGFKQPPHAAISVPPGFKPLA